MWTLVVCLAASCPAGITVDGFSNLEDCRHLGRWNVQYLNPQALHRCDRTGRPAVRCKPDTRTYGRTGECLT